jgi:hypothetical protein
MQKKKKKKVEKFLFFAFFINCSIFQARGPVEWRIFSCFCPMSPQQVLWGLFFYQKLNSGAMNLQKSGLSANLVHDQFWNQIS